MFELKGKGKTHINFSLKDKKYVIIGRGSSCDLRLESGKLSRKHCIIKIEQDRITIEDLGSKNGTKINGKHIKQVTEMHVGDELAFSDAFAFELKGKASADKHETPEVGPAPFAEDSGESASGELPAVVTETSSQSLSAFEPPKAHPALKEASNSKVMLYTIAGVAVMLLVIVALIKANKAPEKPKVDPDAEFSKILNGVVSQLDKFEKEGYDQTAVEVNLKKASLYKPNASASYILKDISKLIAQSSGNYEKYNWVEAKSLTKELIDAQPKTDKVEFWAKKHLSFLNEESRHIEYVIEMRLQNDKEDWQGVIDSYNKIPDDCRFKPLYRNFYTNAVVTMAGKTLSSAREALEQENWSKAIQRLKVARNYLAPEDKQDIALKIAEAEKNLKNSNLISEVQTHFESKDYVKVIEVAATLDEDSKYHQTAHKLSMKAQYEIDVRQALNKYNDGSAEEALKDLEGKENVTDLVNRIKKVLEELKLADMAMKKRELDKAVSHWKNVHFWEKNEKNWYFITAQNNINQWGSDKKLSITFKEWGDEAYAKKEYKIARHYYQKASNYDEELVKEPLEKMSKLGYKYFNMGNNLKSINLRKAIDYLKKVVELLPPDDGAYLASKEIIEKVGPKLEENPFEEEENDDAQKETSQLDK